MLLPHATRRASEGHFVHALQACVQYFSAYPRITVQITCQITHLQRMYPIVGRDTFTTETPY
jgi:hypothetical protein